MKKIEGFKLANTVLATALMLALSGCGDTAPNDETTTTVSSSDDTSDSTSSTSSAADPDYFTIFSDSLDEDWTTYDCCSGTTPTTTEDDDDDYGTVIEFTIGDYDDTVMGFESDSGEDVSSISDDGSLVFDLKVVTAPTSSDASWYTKMEGDDSSSGEISIDTPETGVWTSYSIPLSDFETAGITLSDDVLINKVMIFPTWSEGAGADYYIDNIGFDSGTTTDSTSYSLYSSDDGTLNATVSEPGWGSGSYLVDSDITDDSSYSHVMEWEMGDGWGGPAVACSISDLSDVSGYNTFNVKVKYTSTADTGFFEVQTLASSSGVDQLIIYDTDTDYWTDLGNDWVQISIPVSAFSSWDSVDQFVLIVKDDESNPVYFTDINFE